MKISNMVAVREVAGLVILCLASAPAAAGLRMDLQGGFSPDPTSLELTARTSFPAADAVRGCPGHMAAEPDLVIDLDWPSSPLAIHAAAERLVGLLVIGPDGIYRCAAVDDAGVAGLRVTPAQAGSYAVLPLTDAPGAVDVRILLTERDLYPDELARAIGTASSDLAVDAAPAHGVLALPADGSESVEVGLRPVTGAEIAGPGCYGQIDPSRPDAVLQLDVPEPALAIRARSDVDTTLVVVGPDGSVHCNDDTYGLDPEVIVTDAASGDWAIWVGRYSGSGDATARLQVYRPGDPQAAPGLAHEAPAAAGLHILAGEAALNLPLQLFGETPAGEIDWTCAGNIEPNRPDAVIRLETEAPHLHLRVRSERDTTMVVHAPDGTLHCNDDTYGLDPAVTLAPADAGDYAVWVGVFSGAGGGSATLEATFAEPAPDEWSDFGDVGAQENPFEGRTLSSAVEAFEILLDQGIGEMLAFDMIEPQGDEGFVLHGVTVSDMFDPNARLAIDRVVVANLDLAGLEEKGEPDRFSLSLEGVNYADLVGGQGMFALLPSLPALAEEPNLNLRVSLMPSADATGRRDFDLAGELERQFAMRLTARVAASEDGAAGLGLEEALTEAMSLEFENRGFLGHLLRVQAAEMGVEPAQAASMVLDGFREALDPVLPGTPSARFIDAIGLALADPDQRGVIRLNLATDEPQGLEALLEEFQSIESADDRLRVDLSYEPIP